MPQHYKLRLSDGTTLVVDHDGLATWLVDETAMVQVPGSEQWRPLRGVVAAAERRASRAVTAPAPAVTEVPAVDSPPIGEPRGLLVLADDPGRSRAARVQAPSKDDAAPVIPLKPLDDGEARRGDVWDGEDAEDVSPGRPLLNARDERVLAALVRFGTSLSPWLERLDRRIPRGRSRHSVQGAPSWIAEVGPWVQGVVAAGRGLVTSLLRFVPRSRPPVPMALETAKAVPAPPASRPAPVEPQQAPLPIQEVPILRLADVQEPAEPEVLYGDGDRWQAGWAWAKNLLLAASVAAGAVALAVTWESWLPTATMLSRALFGEVDAWTRSREQGERRAQALREARAQLPQLAPVTLQLVVSASPADALEPPALFRLACDVADRGRPTLPPEGARELEEIRQQMLLTLSPAERERALEYDEARSHRATLPFEDRDALGLFARGARALPPAARARLQALLGEAIADGLKTSRGAASRP